MLIGWLAPNGKMYNCNTYEHIEKAFEVSKKYYGEEKGDTFLLLNGFCHITRAYIFMCDTSLQQVKLSDKQITFFLENEQQLNCFQKESLGNLLDWENFYDDYITGDEDLVELERTGESK